MVDRASARRAFVEANGWGDAWESLLAGDASFRTYYRLTRGRQTVVVMDAPPPQEDVRPFVRLARHLRDLGLSAPEIRAVDEAGGFLLEEDLGDTTYARRLLARHDPDEERALYTLATDVLVHLAAQGSAAVPPGLARYAGEALIDAAMLLPEWYLPQVAGRPATAAELESYREAWRDSLRALPSSPTTLVLRDYHQDNLLWLGDRPGVRACGLLDFQDATSGHPAYDLMSLLEDARRDIGEELRAAMIARYLEHADVTDRPGFLAAFAILGAQRHARVVGLFIRLLRRDGKPIYLPHLPRVWRLLENALRHEAMTPLRRWIDAHIPPDQRGNPT
ncbi:MAG: phosphotransferase [Alphaproteobacteria bacterium]|nr:phosphotransferase [Alphaproteobacteria bacterium]MCW5741444.1 phosphotransferase [Alphaproteobacteria bacterium]